MDSYNLAIYYWISAWWEATASTPTSSVSSWQHSHSTPPKACTFFIIQPDLHLQFAHYNFSFHIRVSCGWHQYIHRQKHFEFHPSRIQCRWLSQRHQASWQQHLFLLSKRPGHRGSAKPRRSYRKILLNYHQDIPYSIFLRCLCPKCG